MARTRNGISRNFGALYPMRAIGPGESKPTANNLPSPPRCPLDRGHRRKWRLIRRSTELGLGLAGFEEGVETGNGRQSTEDDPAVLARGVGSTTLRTAAQKSGDEDAAAPDDSDRAEDAITRVLSLAERST